MSVYEQNLNHIIYKSNWAISKKYGNKVQKVFLHDAYLKIQKEVRLLELSLGKNIHLSYDRINKHWICESDFMELSPIINNIYLDDLVLQLKDIFASWKYDIRYLNLVSDEWTQTIVPWYCLLLQQYIPNSERQVILLQNSQGEHFIHGDFTLSNVYLNNNLKVIVIDYENATLGPMLWDETTLVYSCIEQKQYSMAKRLYEIFSCKKEMLQTISSIRLAQSIRKAQNIKLRTNTYNYIYRNY